MFYFKNKKLVDPQIAEKLIFKHENYPKCTGNFSCSMTPIYAKYYRPLACMTKADHNKDYVYANH